MPRRRAKGIGTEEKAIGRRLREARELANLTQVQFAAKLGLDQTLISAYERGAIRMHAALVAQMAKVLGSTTDEILGLQRARRNGVIRSRGLRKRLPEMDRLPPRDLRTLLQTVDTFLKAARAPRA